MSINDGEAIPLLRTPGNASSSGFHRKMHGVKERFRRKPMTDHDRLLLDPWQKWQQYNRFPWKGILHFAILICIVLQIVLHSAQFARYERETFKSLSYLLTPKSNSGSTKFLMNRVRISHSVSKSNPSHLGKRHRPSSSFTLTQVLPFPRWCYWQLCLRLHWWFTYRRSTDDSASCHSPKTTVQYNNQVIFHWLLLKVI